MSGINELFSDGRNRLILFLAFLIVGFMFVFVGLKAFSTLAPTSNDNVQTPEAPKQVGKSTAGDFASPEAAKLVQQQNKTNLENIFGNIFPSFSYNSKISNLKINTDDILIISGTVKKRQTKILFKENFKEVYEIRKNQFENLIFSIIRDIEPQELEFQTYRKKTKSTRWIIK